MLLKNTSPPITLPSEFTSSLNEYSGNATKCLIFFRRVQLERQPVILKKFILTCSYETIRRATGIKSNVAIKSAINELTEKGWIETTFKGYVKKGLTKESNTYILINPDGTDATSNTVLEEVLIENVAPISEVHDTIKSLKSHLKG